MDKRQTKSTDCLKGIVHLKKKKSVLFFSFVGCNLVHNVEAALFLTIEVDDDPNYQARILVNSDFSLFLTQNYQIISEDYEYVMVLFSFFEIDSPWSRSTFIIYWKKLI